VGWRARGSAARDCIVRPEEVEALVVLIRDESTPAGVRTFATRGLARAASADVALPVLVERGDYDALVEVGPPAIPHVAAAIHEDGMMFTTLVLLVTDHPESAEARAAVGALLPYVGGEGRHAALANRAVVAFGPELPGLLIERLRSDGDARAHAARALGMIEDMREPDRAAAIRALERAETDDDPAVSRAAGEALRRIRSASPPPPPDG
jgi:hypothetical protein